MLLPMLISKWLRPVDLSVLLSNVASRWHLTLKLHGLGCIHAAYICVAQELMFWCHSGSSDNVESKTH